MRFDITLPTTLSTSNFFREWITHTEVSNPLFCDMWLFPSTRIHMKHVKKAMIFMIDIFIDILKKNAFFEGGYLKITQENRLFAVLLHKII